MDKVFEKFGLYDFMGIWGPGAIFCVYFTYSYSDLVKNILFATDLNVALEYFLFYIGIAYFVGVVFHEVGKWFVDKIKPLFDFDRYRQIERLKLKETTKWCLFTPRALQYRYVKILSECDALPQVSFDKAYSKLKYGKRVDRKRINVYHSVYGLSRGIFIGLIVHFVISLILLVIELVGGYASSSEWFVIVDLPLIYIFFCRTVRYFISWVMNVYIQFKFVIDEEKQE